MKLVLMLLASLTWAFPTPVQAKTKVNLPEANIEIKQEVKEFYGPKNIQKEPDRKPENNQRRIQNAATSTGSSGYSGRNYSGKVYSKEEVQSLIISYSQQYGVNPEVPLCIARLESGLNQFSKNKSSSASGVFQYLTSTFAQTDEGKSGLSVLDADANVKAAIKYMASRRNTHPWVVANKCPNL